MVLTLSRYTTVQDFVDENGVILEQHELENTFVLLTCKALAKQESLGASYCGTVWDVDDNGKRHHVISITAMHTLCMYPSLPRDKNKQAEVQAAIEMLVKDALQTSLEIKHIYGNEPETAMLVETWNTLASPRYKLKREHAMWSYILTKGDLISVDGKQLQSGILRPFKADEFELLVEWTKAFYTDSGAFAPDDSDEGIRKQCQSEMDQGNTFLWCDKKDGTPKCMLWKRRPMRKGCAVGYVYTPTGFRHGGVARSAVTEFCIECLDKYEYMTLLADEKQDRYTNLYTRIGFKYLNPCSMYSL